jgi:hypothetical protein
VVKLHLKLSHWHILPELILYVLMISASNLDKVYQCDWQSAAIGCSEQVIIAIIAFYFALLFANLARFKESYIGESVFGWHPNRALIMRILVGVGVFLTYFAFICRVVLISAMEAIFSLVLLGTLTGNQVMISDSQSRVFYCWMTLAIFAVMAHTWVEQPYLGKSALIITPVDSVANS